MTQCTIKKVYLFQGNVKLKYNNIKATLLTYIAHFSNNGLLFVIKAAVFPHGCSRPLQVLMYLQHLATQGDKSMNYRQLATSQNRNT